MTRDWKSLENDEIYGIWNSYKQTEFQGFDPLNNRPTFKQSIRLTPMEIIKLVEELMERLEIKESKEHQSGKK